MVCESPSGLALGRAGCRLAAVSHRPDGQGRHGDVGRDGIHHGSEADDDDRHQQIKIERQYVKRRLSGFVFTFARETPPVIDARPVEARKAEDAGHWTSVAGYGEVFTTTELFDVTAARDHFDGTVEASECCFCAFDARNREHHARNAGRLF